MDEEVEKIAGIIKSDSAGYVQLMEHDRKRIAKLIVDAGYRRLPKDEPLFCYEGLTVDFTRHRVSVEGREVNLTITEYRVLSYLAHNAGRVVTSGQILEKVWGKNYIGDTHLLQVSMARLRKKLGDDARKLKYILTRPGIGYILSSRRGTGEG